MCRAEEGLGSRAAWAGTTGRSVCTTAAWGLLGSLGTGTRLGHADLAGAAHSPRLALQVHLYHALSLLLPVAKSDGVCPRACGRVVSFICPPCCSGLLSLWLHVQSE